VTGDFDPVRMEQVIINLMTNALRYGQKKPIEVRVCKGDGRIRLSVQDHGFGIPKESQSKIFDRFERLATPKQVAGGLGLGLYIARQIVNAHQGTISVDSEPGVGSTFTVELAATEGRQVAAAS
jgi:signal transduction histidine kinase